MNTRMFAEAAEAPLAVERGLAENAQRIGALAARLRERAPRAVATLARGSSDHAATYAKYLIETRVGVLVSSAAPSVSSVYAAPNRLADVLVLAISQSGQSPDLIAAAEAAQAAGARVVALVNEESSALARLADETIPLCAGPERAVAATKSYIATLGAIAQLVAAWTEDRALIRSRAALAAMLHHAWELDWSAAGDRLADAQSMFVVARGVGLAAAQEAALKLKETSAIHAEAFSAAEVMHGPLALARPGFPLLALAQSDETHASVAAAADAFAARGADVLFAGAGRAGALPTIGADPALEPILMVQSFYRMAEALARTRGRDPDNPPHLKKVTETL